MAIKTTRVKELKDISAETDIGGAPFYADDFVRIQRNSKADFINLMEQYRLQLPTLLINGVKEFENGLILSGLEYDNTDPQNPIISPGYIYSGGEICYYAGGTFNTGPILAGIVYLWKGSKLSTNRTFNDGSSKEFLVEYGVNVELGSITAPGPQLPLATTITATDEVVGIGCGVNMGYTTRLAERYFSVNAALQIDAVGYQVERNDWTDATINAGWSVDTNRFSKIVSRITKDPFTEIHGSVKKTFAGGTAVENPINLNAYSLSISSGELPFNVSAYDVSGGTWYNLTATVTTGGLVYVRPNPGDNWPTGDLVLYFDVRILGSVISQYKYTNDFFDIT